MSDTVIDKNPVTGGTIVGSPEFVEAEIARAPHVSRPPDAKIEAGPEGATIGPSPAARAELALLKHLALEGELALRRDQLAAEHQAVTERLIQARQQRARVVQAVREAGGELPRWDL